MTTTLRAACLTACVLALTASASAQMATAEQTAYLKALTTLDGDLFGSSSAISGDTLVIGAPGERFDAVGVDGVPGPTGLSKAGAAYVFVRDGASWVQQAYLKPSNTGADDLFGTAVDIDGDLLVVGAPDEDGFATGVNGNQGDGLGSESSGAAYVFELRNGLWRQVAYLKASDTDEGDQFGTAVAISGETVVVGAGHAGKAYVYTRSGNVWSHQADLEASNATAFHWFGNDVDIAGDIVVVSAPLHSGAASGVNGPEEACCTTRSGAAYVFERDAGVWSQQAYLKASNPDEHDQFGSSVAVSGETVAVGARSEDSAAATVNGEQGDNAASGAGAVYVFRRTAGTWGQEAYVKAANPQAGDTFGVHVELSGELLAVSATGEDSAGVGINPVDDPGALAAQSGAAYVFARSGSTWTQQAFLKPTNTDADDQFGSSIALDGTTLMIGSCGEASEAQGVDGDAFDNSGFLNGAGFSFEIEPGPWTDIGSALAGASGDPLLLGSGTLAAGSANGLDLSNAAPSSFTGVFASLASSPIDFKGGVLAAFPFALLKFVTTNVGGELALPFGMPTGVPAGTQLWVQTAIQDAGAVSGVALSNALKGVTP